jgi:lysophospholipase L1-like esterase
VKKNGLLSVEIIFFPYFCRKKCMKRIVWLICVFIALIIGIIIINNLPYLSPAEKQEGITFMQHDDDTIRVAYIGDSWADGHKKVKCVIDSLVYFSTGRPVVVKTAGISGLTSKNIYYGLFRDRSMRNVIEWGPDFCFVVAGINDTDRKMGKGYYKENMRLIIDLLFEHHITPIILEIPSYDILFSYKRRSRQVKFQYLASMVVTWSKMNCIEDYRTAYYALLDEQGWSDQVITISYKDWNPDGYKDKRGLYDGGLMHLNARGYLVLDTCIAHKIIEKLSVSSDNGNH